ncbi:hypothetical protein D8674_024614 [Pyrus ussuriensis x Pyrus communis]|uniref:Uncharacterized protein n=1 Tax=Pyrus ussuriensis x Pyrus communis TaxID=2448454 RepID=A0A5N5H8H9_9ROSA|nr:hypothetical protein D8674_024614 [Pyrus ussuriensis x Pyrus communis]
MIADSGARSSKRMEGESSGKWRVVHEEIKTHLVDELEPYWDIDQNDPKLMKCIDNIFKSSFWEWKFNVEREAELNRIPEPAATE